MAIVPVEIFCIAHDNIIPIEKAILVLNKKQDAFRYNLLRNDECESFLGLKKNRFTTTEIYTKFEKTIPSLKGYHPYIIGVVEPRLDGEKSGNLFGSMQESDNKQLTGKAIVSIWKVDQILQPIPLEVYLIFEFLSFSIGFVAGHGLIHSEGEFCMFDKKNNKFDIIEIMQKGKFCTSCSREMSRILDNDQMIAINQIINIISNISKSEEPKKVFDSLENQVTNI